MTDDTLKSNAVVKFDPFKLPGKFNFLEPETDLHKPPDDWLEGSNEESRLGLGPSAHPVIPKKASSEPLNLVSTPGGSFHMAYHNLDMVGDVDVIAHSDVVKKLIRLPIDKRQLSIVVHRIGKTLLLDEFDVLALLIATEETEWQWIRDFVQNHVIDELKRKNLHIRKPYGRSTPAAVEHNMMSKFLHYSVPKMLGSQKAFDDQSSVIAPPSPDEIMNLPEPPDQPECSSHKVEDSTRTVLWEFENMQMLLGSNLPIFGGADHPVVSLRLHDASKPINVLTGLDYWLDNLICNVPELAMCFHINGIVQKYEVYKTMDIPNLENSKFSPTAVRDIAQNILSFLNNNCAKEGHTYWLFKPHGDEIVKLYDLTSICEATAQDDTEGDRDSYQSMRNPFSIPVAFLLYRVAKNLVAKFSHDNERSSKVRDTVYSLLRNALKLIQEARVHNSSNSASDAFRTVDPQCRDLEGCIYFLLVQLYIPSGPWKDWASGGSDSDSVDDLGSESGDSCNADLDDNGGQESKSSAKSDPQVSTSDESSTDFRKGVSVDRKLFMKSDRNLMREHRQAHEYSHLDLTIEQRCKSALEYTLKCFQFLQSYSFEQSSESPSNEQSLISLKSNKSWRSSIKCSLLYKLAVILSTFGLQCVDTNKYGRAFRYLKLALSACCSIGSGVSPESDERSTEAADDCKSGSLLLGKVLQLMGDVFALFANCTNSSEQSEFHIEEATKGHTEMELQLSCFLTPNNNDIYSKIDQFSLSGDYSRCIESAASIYNLCQEHMKTIQRPQISKSEKLESNSKGAEKVYSSAVTKVEQRSSKGSSKGQTKKKSGEGGGVKPVVIDVQEWAFTGEESLLKRMGNVNNELGRMYENKLMEKCSTIKEGERVPSEADSLLKQSKSHFEKAQDHFTQIGDRANVGLVLGNTGRLCRIWAHILSVSGSTSSDPGENKETSTAESLSEMEKSYYYKAIDYYRQALSHIEHSGDPNLVSNVTWDLCSTYFTLGRQIQDHSTNADPKVRERYKQEVVDNLTKALKYCIPPSNKGVDASQLLVLQVRHSTRLGEIHQRLGSLYHHSFRYDSEADRSLHALAEFHYSKAADCFHIKFYDNYTDNFDRIELYTRVQLERVALLEFQITITKVAKLIAKMLTQALVLLCEAFSALDKLGFGSHSLSSVYSAQTKKVLLSCVKFFSLSSNVPKKPAKLETSPKDDAKLLYAKCLKIEDSDLQAWKSVQEPMRKIVVALSQV